MLKFPNILDQATIFCGDKPFETMIEDMFYVADADNSGKLSPREFLDV